MRGYTQAASADLLACGHAFIQNLRNGFSRRTAMMPRELRLIGAWSQLTQAIEPALRLPSRAIAPSETRFTRLPM